MDEFQGRVAVVTGAASGIGLGMARRFAEAGMRVVLADVEAPALQQATDELRAAGHDVHSVVTDVSVAESVSKLCDQAHAHFEKVHVLCNNAGVAGGGGGALWETTAHDWAWVLGVNLMGVVHGLQAFVPRMLEHGEPGHVVNTSSILGVTSGPGSIYGVSKHAVTRLSEGLHHDLKLRRARLGVSVLLPGLIATRIVSASRNRPDHLQNPGADAAQSAFRDQAQQRFLEMGMPPEQVGDIVLDAMRSGRFYVFTHPELKRGIEVRMQDILNESAPTTARRPSRRGRP